MLHSKTFRKTIKVQRDLPCIFVHAGAGYHSIQNERIHLQACTDATTAAMAVLRSGGSAIDAVEIAIKVLEDREITNAGYGSNLTMDGVVECDAVVVDHHGRSGAVGAVAQVKNPISLARTVLDHSTRLLSLRRVPPNLLVGQGATEFAASVSMPILPHDALISPAAKDRWLKWRADLKEVDRQQKASSARVIARPRIYGRDRNMITYPSEPPIDLTRDPLAEDHIREQMRRAHTNALESGVWNEAQPISPPPSSDSLAANARNGSLNNGLHQANHPRLSEQTLFDPASAVYMDPFGPPGMHQGLGRTTYTHTLGNTAAEGRHVNDGHDSGQYYLTDTIEMNDYYAPATLSEIDSSRHSAWNDGSSESSDDASSSSSGSLQLPSLTPSPEPLKQSTGMSPNLDAVNTKLPDTPSEKAKETPSDSHSTPLTHVSERLPLPRVPEMSKLSPVPEDPKRDDHITDTVGAVAIDMYGNIACGASSGGIGMKHRGRIGPAALVGVGAAVIPADPEDKDNVCVGVVTSGTGEHMATTMAATVTAERLYHGVKKGRGATYTDTDDADAIKMFVERDFMGHPSVKNSHSAGAVGVLAVKRTPAGIYLYFAHNTDSFALASMHGDEKKPVCTMSRNRGNSTIAQGGRSIKTGKRKAA